MDRVPEIKLIRAAFVGDAVKHVAAIRDVSREDVEYYAREVVTGRCNCAAITVDGRTVGAMLYVTSVVDEEPTLIVDALRCETVAGLCMVDELVPMMEELARHEGVIKMRCFTRRDGLVERLSAHGFQPRTMMERAVDYVQ